MWVVWRRGDGAKSVFFFQAEDGIRDRDVTGVQTCALPIYRSDHQPFADRILAGPEAPRRGLANDHNRRSEERRVGKECRCRWLPDEKTKNINIRNMQIYQIASESDIF